MKQDRPYNRKQRQEWEIVEVAVRENAGVEISMLPLQVPRFSFRVGTAHYPEHEGDSIKISSRLTIFNISDAVDLLADMEVKYTKIREDKIEEMEDRKKRARSRVTGTPEVSVRRESPDE